MIVKHGTTASVAWERGSKYVYKCFLVSDDRGSGTNIPGYSVQQYEQEFTRNWLVLTRLYKKFVKKYTPLIFDSSKNGIIDELPLRIIQGLQDDVDIDTGLEDVLKGAGPVQAAAHLLKLRPFCRHMTQRGLMNGDFHVGNVVIGPDGVARVVDFGSVQLIGDCKWFEPGAATFATCFPLYSERIMSLCVNELALLRTLVYDVCEFVSDE